MPMFSLDFEYKKTNYNNRKSFSRNNSDDEDSSLKGSYKNSLGQPYYPRTSVERSGKLDFGEFELEFLSLNSRYMLRGQNQKRWHGWCKPSCIPISIILVLTALVVLLSLLDQKWEEKRKEDQLILKQQWEDCRNSCRANIVESIPEGLYYNVSLNHMSTFDSWVQLIKNAEKKIDIGSYYWSLLDENTLSEKGKEIYDLLLNAGKDRGVKIRIAHNIDTKGFPNTDVKNLEEAGAAEVRSVNFSRLTGGILHTKIWIVDDKATYIGSANMDWRSLTQVKELGIFVQNCSCFAKDLNKIFNAYWKMGENDSKIPDKWPKEYETLYNNEMPMDIAFNGTKYQTFLSSSPSQFCAKGRTSDLDAIIDVINNATEFIHVAVMDYFPITLYTQHTEFWPDIDNSLRAAAINNKVSVRILMSKWNHTRPSAYNFLKSLKDLNDVSPHVNIEIRMFSINSTAEQEKIPFARVNHNKYMVTDKAAYIGTSNWSADYFINTGGVGFISSTNTNSSVQRNDTDTDDNIRSQLADVFERDWNSAYSESLEDAFHKHCNR